MNNCEYKPLVSIVTVVFNCSNSLERTIQSVISQNYNNIQYIIIDGGSTDGSVEIIKTYSSFLYYWVSEQDSGIYNAWNKGLKKATGDIIGILNADDWYFPDTINNVIEISKEIVEEKFIITGAIKKFKSNNSFYQCVTNKKQFEQRIIKEMYINHPATFVSSAVYKDIGYFSENYRISSDYDFILRAHIRKIPFYFTNKILVNMDLGGTSNKFSNLCLMCNEKYKIRKPYLNSFYNFITAKLWLFGMIIKNLLNKISS